MRKQNKKPIAIVCSDLHLSDKPPLCRAGEKDWFGVMKRNIKFITGLSAENECPIILAGDVFDYWRPSNQLINEVAGWFEENPIYFIAGQHDLEGNNMNNYFNSGLSILAEMCDWWLLSAKGLRIFETNFIVYGYNYGEEIQDKKSHCKSICVLHKLTYMDDAHILLKKLKSFDIVITGDNHERFTVGENNQTLINPGSMMRIKADQEDYQPKVCLLLPEAISEKKLPIEKDIFSREHIEVANNLEESLNTFIKVLKNKMEVGELFENNLINYIRAQAVEQQVKDLIWEAVNG